MPGRAAGPGPDGVPDAPPAHRPQGLGPEEALAEELKRDWDIAPIEIDDLEPPAGSDPVQLGYLDSHFKQAFRLTLKDPQTVAAALPEKSAAYRGLDTAVLEALVLKGPLGLTEDDISELRGLDYARSFEEARELVESGTFDAGFFLRGIPVAQIREIAAAGVNMPPKSTYFFPKVPTGLLFNPLTGAE